MEARFEQWIAHHGRVYEDAVEKARRFDIFKANVERIDSVNADESLSYRLGVNQFADRTMDELNSRCCVRRSKAKKADNFREELPPRQLAHSRPIEVPMETLFEQCIAHHARVYKDGVEKARHLTKTPPHYAYVERIDSVNADESLSYRLRVNQFADRTMDELNSRSCVRSTSSDA